MTATNEVREDSVGVQGRTPLKMTLKTLEITWIRACCPLYTDAKFGREMNVVAA